RKSLMDTFDQIYVLDLHGSTKKKERAPDGGEDQNVFDIVQGVAIALFAKGRNLERGVWHADLWGKRLSKYEAVAQSSKSSVAWEALEPGPPDWLMRPQNVDLAKRYRTLWSVPAILGGLGDPAPGIVTTQDDFAISFSPEEARVKVQKLINTASEQ